MDARGAKEGDPVAPMRLGDAAVASFDAEGFLRIPNVIDGDVAAEMYQEVMAIVTATGGHDGNKLKQSSQYLAGTMIDRVVNSENLRVVAEQLLRGPSSVYLPFTAVKGRGGGQFHLHQDNNYTHFDGPGLNLWIALMTIERDGGCLLVFPRSHLAGTLESENAGDGDSHRKVSTVPTDLVPLPMRAGDCVAFGRLMVHGSGPNNTDAPRVAYAVQYYRNDVTFTDRTTGEHLLLRDRSPQRSRTQPVEAIG